MDSTDVEKMKNGGDNYFSGIQDLNLFPFTASPPNMFLRPQLSLPQVPDEGLGFQFMTPPMELNKLQYSSGRVRKTMETHSSWDESDNDQEEEEEADKRSAGGGHGIRRSGNTKVCTRGHWRPAEDAKLKDLVSHFGPQNWNLIAEHLQGRSGN